MEFKYKQQTRLNIFLIIFDQKIKIDCFMQIVCWGDILHDISSHILSDFSSSSSVISVLLGNEELGILDEKYLRHENIYHPSHLGCS